MVAPVPDKITFFSFLMPLIVSGKKNITIRDESESHYVPGSKVGVYTLETNEQICDIEIISVEPLGFEDIDEFHAKQEALELPRLKELIKEIYPNTDKLFMITYKLLSGIDL